MHRESVTCVFAAGDTSVGFGPDRADDRGEDSLSAQAAHPRKGCVAPSENAAIVPRVIPPFLLHLYKLVV